jgi:hypothetical protein
LQRLWKAMVMYWLLLQAQMGGESYSVVSVELGKQEVHDVELISGG